MMYYKFNLKLKIVFGLELFLKACKMKNELKSPQWLRNIKRQIISMVAD